MKRSIWIILFLINNYCLSQTKQFGEEELNNIAQNVASNLFAKDRLLSSHNNLVNYKYDDYTKSFFHNEIIMNLHKIGFHNSKTETTIKELKEINPFREKFLIYYCIEGFTETKDLIYSGVIKMEGPLHSRVITMAVDFSGRFYIFTDEFKNDFNYLIRNSFERPLNSGNIDIIVKLYLNAVRGYYYLGNKIISLKRDKTKNGMLLKVNYLCGEDKKEKYVSVIIKNDGTIICKD